MKGKAESSFDATINPAGFRSIAQPLYVWSSTIGDALVFCIGLTFHGWGSYAPLIDYTLALAMHRSHWLGLQE